MDFLRYTLLCTGYIVALILTGCRNQTKPAAAEGPLVPGHFADPSILKHEGNYYLYATIDPWGGDELAVFESADLVNWTRRKLNWPTKAACVSPTSNDSRVWAPSVIRGKDGKFYMYVSVGSEIWAGVADTPLGPWKNAKADNSPLIAGNMIPGFHMIDAEVFIDDDGKVYLYWGSGLDWKNGHCFAVMLDDDMISFDPENVRDITPANYFEAPFMLKQEGKYILMYSNGKCTDATYNVRYVVGDTPHGPWSSDKMILATTADSSTLGPGHHTVLSENNKHYILYHRIADNNNTLLREIVMDDLIVSGGEIEPIKLNSNE